MMRTLFPHRITAMEGALAIKVRILRHDADQLGAICVAAAVAVLYIEPWQPPPPPRCCWRPSWPRRSAPPPLCPPALPTRSTWARTRSCWRWLAVSACAASAERWREGAHPRLLRLYCCRARSDWGRAGAEQSYFNPYTIQQCASKGQCCGGSDQNNNFPGDFDLTDADGELLQLQLLVLWHLARCLGGSPADHSFLFNDLASHASCSLLR